MTDPFGQGMMIGLMDAESSLSASRILATSQDLIVNRERSSSIVNQEIIRWNSFQAILEKKVHNVLEHVSGQVLKQQFDLRGFKSEMDIYTTTLELISRQVKEQFQEIAIIQNYQVSVLDSKLKEIQLFFEEKQNSLNLTIENHQFNINHTQVSQPEQLKSHELKMKSQRQIDIGPSDNQIHEMNQKILEVEKNIKTLHKQWKNRLDDEKQATLIIEKLRGDVFKMNKQQIKRKLQEIFQKKFKEDATMVFENTLAPFKILVDTRITNFVKNLQELTSSVKTMEQSMQINVESINIYKKEIIYVQANINKNLALYHDELEKINMSIPLLNICQVQQEEQIQSCRKDIDTLKKDVQELVLLDRKFEDEKLKRENISIDGQSSLESSLLQSKPFQENVPKVIRRQSVCNQNETQNYLYNNNDYLNKVETQIKFIYKKIKQIKKHDQIPKQKMSRVPSKSLTLQKKQEILPTISDIKYLNSEQKQQIDQPDQVSPKFQKPKNEYNLMNNQQYQKKDYNMFYPNEKLKIRGKTEQQSFSLLSDEHYYQQYKSQLEDIQDKLNLNFEIKNSFPQYHYPSVPFKIATTEKSPSKLNQTNRSQNNKIQMKDHQYMLTQMEKTRRKNKIPITSHTTGMRDISSLIQDPQGLQIL